MKLIVNLVSVSALSVQSNTLFADVSSVLSDPYRLLCAEHDGDGHTAAVSSQCSSGVLKNDCVKGFGKQMCDVSSALRDVVWTTSWFGLRQCSARQLEVVHSLVTHGVPRRSMKAVRVARLLGPPPDTNRSLPEHCNPTPEGKSGIPPTDRDRLGRSTGGFWTATSPRNGKPEHRDGISRLFPNRFSKSCRHAHFLSSADGRNRRGRWQRIPTIAVSSEEALWRLIGGGSLTS